MADALAGYLSRPSPCLAFLTSDSPHAAARGCLGYDERGICGATEKRKADGLAGRILSRHGNPWISSTVRTCRSVVDGRAAVNFTELCFKQRDFLYQSLMADSQLADLNIV